VAELNVVCDPEPTVNVYPDRVLQAWLAENIRAIRASEAVKKYLFIRSDSGEVNELKNKIPDSRGRISGIIS
jgi:hypothetical protein